MEPGALVAAARAGGFDGLGASPGLTAPAHGLTLQRVHYPVDPFAFRTGS